jgi:hypothetical protein
MFQELFKQHQVQHPVIIINGMKFADVKLVIEFMYRGEIKVWSCLSPLCEYKCIKWSMLSGYYSFVLGGTSESCP